MQQIMEDLMFILTKSTIHTIIREILLEIKVLCSKKDEIENFQKDFLYNFGKLRMAIFVLQKNF